MVISSKRSGLVYQPMAIRPKHILKKKQICRRGGDVCFHRPCGNGVTAAVWAAFPLETIVLSVSVVLDARLDVSDHARNILIECWRQDLTLGLLIRSGRRLETRDSQTGLSICIVKMLSGPA